MRNTLHPKKGIALLETALFLMVMFTLAFGGWGLVVYQWEKNSLAEAIDRRVQNFRDRGFNENRSLRAIVGQLGSVCWETGSWEIAPTELADDMARDLDQMFSQYGSGGYWLEVSYACFKIQETGGDPGYLNEPGPPWTRSQSVIRGQLSVPSAVLAGTEFDPQLEEMAQRRRPNGASVWAHPRAMFGNPTISPGQYVEGVYVVMVRAVRKVDAGPIQVLKSLIDFDPYLLEQRVVVLR